MKFFFNSRYRELVNDHTPYEVIHIDQYTHTDLPRRCHYFDELTCLLKLICFRSFVLKLTWGDQAQCAKVKKTKTV